MLETRPCTFCNGRSHYIKKRPLARRTYSHFNVYCVTCGSLGPVSESAEGAIERWNIRNGEVDKKYISDLLYNLREQVLLQVRSALRTNYSADRERLKRARDEAYDLTGDTVLLISKILLKLRTGHKHEIHRI